MDNYKLYANLIRKPDSSDFNARPCVVEKWVTLRHWSFEQIKHDPLHDLEAVRTCDLIDADDISWITRKAVAERLAQHPAIVSAEFNTLDIPFQPDIDIKTEPLKEIKFYCPLRVVRDIDYEDNEVYPEDAALFYDNIKYALAEFEEPEEKDRGLMYWYLTATL